MKVIFHLDLDSYFVSAERTVNPSLQNKPVAITSKKRRSIISAASYEAKSRGVYVPMPYYKAIELVPDLIAVEPNFALYTILSTRMFELISNKITTKIEVASIDECYLDVTDVWEKYGSPVKLAKYIQSLILKELKLPISIGIADNKFVAKMSTQINKPLGITVTKPGDFYNVFSEWPIIKIHGIGFPTSEKLRSIGINTIGDLINSDINKIKDKIGINAIDLWMNVNEKGSSSINTEMNDLKGIGNSITFMDKDRKERVEILEILKNLCYKVSLRLKNRNMAGKVISVQIKEKGGKEIKGKRKQRTLKRPINGINDIFSEAMKLFDEIWDESSLKFISINVSSLTDVFENKYQQSIFDEKVEMNKIDKIIHDVNSKFNSNVLHTLEEEIHNVKKEQNQSRFLEADRIIKK